MHGRTGVLVSMPLQSPRVEFDILVLIAHSVPVFA